MSDRNKGDGVVVAILLVLILLVGGGGVTAYWFYQRQQTLIEVERIRARDQFQQAERAVQAAVQAQQAAEQVKDSLPEGDVPENETTNPDESTDTNSKE